MAERGLNPFVKAFIYFARSLKPSFIRNPPAKLVGTDHLGNKYYEAAPNPSRTKRTSVRSFEPPNEDDWDVPLPPEWDAWLRRKRKDPPTEEEMQLNLKRLAQLEAKRLPTSSQAISPQESTNFPKLADYEETPGSKYNKK